MEKKTLLEKITLIIIGRKIINLMEAMAIASCKKKLVRKGWKE